MLSLRFQNPQNTCFNNKGKKYHSVGHLNILSSLSPGGEKKPSKCPMSLKKQGTVFLTQGIISNHLPLITATQQNLQDNFNIFRFNSTEIRLKSLQLICVSLESKCGTLTEVNSFY